MFQEIIIHSLDIFQVKQVSESLEAERVISKDQKEEINLLKSQLSDSQALKDQITKDLELSTSSHDRLKEEKVS